MNIPTPAFARLRKWKYLCLLLFLGAVLSTCVNPLEVEVPDETQGLVVNASLTTYPGLQEVRLYKSAAFTTRALYYAVTNAQVWVEDELEQRQFFFESVKNSGIYLPQNRNFVGEIGKTYVLHISTSNNQTFASKPEKLKGTPPIKKIYPEAIISEDPVMGQVLSGYKILLDTDDPASKGDYYRWSWVHYERQAYCLTFDGIPFGGNLATRIGIACCETECWDIHRCYLNCTNVLSDALINGRSVSRQALHSIPYCPRDYYIEVQQRSISKDAYNYWRTVDQLSSNNGSIFDSAPAAVRGNMSCTSDSTLQVYGLFEVADVYETGVFIDRIPAQFTIPPLFTCEPTPISANPFECRPCVESAFRTRIKPKYWTK